MFRIIRNHSVFKEKSLIPAPLPSPSYRTGRKSLRRKPQTISDGRSYQASSKQVEQEILTRTNRFHIKTLSLQQGKSRRNEDHKLWTGVISTCTERFLYKGGTFPNTSKMSFSKNGNFFSIRKCMKRKKRKVPLAICKAKIILTVIFQICAG